MLEVRSGAAKKTVTRLVDSAGAVPGPLGASVFSCSIEGVTIAKSHDRV